MPTPLEHEVCVDRWLARTGARGDPVLLLERGLKALWERAAPTLGPVTLSAIAERVRTLALERYPVLEGISVTDLGVTVERLPLGANGARDGIRFFLVEFLTVLGNVTADILTPALHAVLSGMTEESES